MMVHHRAWQTKLRDHGLEMTLEEVRESIHGINDEILVRLFGDGMTSEQRKRFAYEKEEEYRNIFKSELQLIEGLPQFLVDLRENNIPMAIGSAAPPENVDFVLDNLNLRSYFTTVLHAGDVTKGKPDPEIYQRCAAGLQLSPSDCLVFEDSPTGAEAAIRAGCQLIVVTTTHTVNEFDRLAGVSAFVPDFRNIDQHLPLKKSQ